MAAIDEGCNHFIAHEAKAAAESRRLNRSLYQVDAAVMAMIAETEVDALRHARKQFEASKAPLKRLMADLQADAPAYSDRIDAIDLRVATYLKDASAVAELGAGNENIAALDLLHRTVRTYFDALVTDITVFGDELQTHVTQGSALLAEQTAHNSHLTIGLCLGGLLLGVGVAVFVTIFGITRPLAAQTAVMARLDADDTDVDVPGIGRRDELGSVASAVQVFKENIIRTRALEEETALARASAEEQRKKATRDMADAFEQAVSGIIGAVTSAATELQATAQSMAGTATQTAFA